MTDDATRRRDDDGGILDDVKDALTGSGDDADAGARGDAGTGGDAGAMGADATTGAGDATGTDAGTGATPLEDAAAGLARDDEGRITGDPELGGPGTNPPR